ncbi:MAG TPA: protoporphyrinogen oxidase [Gemmatales bacterium]|nr:protoporphyrinogen oxidase [Gemmatales bacterium]
MQRIVVIGGGISGLATAYHLQQRLPDARVTVVEARGRLGGTIHTEERDGFRLELGPNGFLNNKSSTLRLCRSLGLESELVVANPAAARRFLYENQQLTELPHGLGSLVASPLLSWTGLWRLATERFRRTPPPAGDESVYDFLVRRISPEIAEQFADALVTGVFAGDPRQLSLAAAFPRLADAERRYGSVSRGLPKLLRSARAELAAPGRPKPKRTALTSFRRGLRTLIDALVSRLRTPPHLGMSVRHVGLTTREPRPLWSVELEDAEPLEADAIVLTLPAPRQAGLIADLDGELADLMLQIPYVSVAVVAMGFRAQDVPTDAVDGFGYISPQRTRRDLLGVQFCSSIFAERAPSGMVLVRALCGGWQRPEVMTWEDDRLGLAARRELRFALGIARPPVLMHICRWDPAIPQYTLGHLERVAQIEEKASRWPGLYLGGNAYHGVALNDCTAQAERIADAIARYCSGLK